MDYASTMSRLVNSVLIRSTIGTSEPRYRHISEILGKVASKTMHINWARSSEDANNLLNANRKVFQLPAPYGGGIRNYLSHLRFQIFVFRTLWLIKPQVIYACDLDTFIPSLIYRSIKPSILVFDQFDPLSARVNTRYVRKVLDCLEFSLVKKADIRVTANILRIPEDRRETWVEIKNLFPLRLNVMDHRYKQGTFQLLYGGILSHDRGLMELIRVIQEKSSWRIDVYGQGPVKEDLVLLSSSNVAIHEYLPHDQLMNRAQSSDLYVALYDPSNRNNRLTASNKLFEAAQLGVPLLTSKGTYLGDIVQKFKLGWAVSYGDTAEITMALDDFASLSEIERFEILDNLNNFFQEEIRGQLTSIKELEHRITSMANCGSK